MSNRRCIIVVDDDESICKILQKFFELKGHTCDYALSIDKAIQMIKKQRYHVMLLDLYFPPVGNGINFLKYMNQEDLKRDMKIIIITGNAAMWNVIECMKRGACDVIQKPFKCEKLYQNIMEAIGECAKCQ